MHFLSSFDCGCDCRVQDQMVLKGTPERATRILGYIVQDIDRRIEQYAMDLRAKSLTNKDNGPATFLDHDHHHRNSPKVHVNEKVI